MGFAWDQAVLTQNKPKGQTNSGSFNGNPYQNPQMGQYGGGGPPGWGNQNSAMYDWQQGFAPDQAAWMGDAPGHLGQGYSYNPQTGQGGYVNTSGGLSIGGANPYGSGAVSWIDPLTGMKSINPSALMNLFGQLGMGGGDGYQSFNPSEFGGPDITAPGAYGGGNWENPFGLNTEEVIESYRPMMQNEIDQGFAQAGSRMGQSGMAMSTPYAQKLGEVSDLATAKMNNMALQYGYDASKFDRQQALARQMAQNQEGFNMWQQGGNWDMQAQSQNAQNDFNQWMAQNQWGFQDNQGQNQWNQNEQNQQNNWLAQLLGGLF